MIKRSTTTSLYYEEEARATAVICSDHQDTHYGEIMMMGEAYLKIRRKGMLEIFFFPTLEYLITVHYVGLNQKESFH